MENNSNSSPIVKPLAERYAEASSLMQEAITSVETVYIGQPEVVKLSFACLVASGHLALEGPPSVGKTTLANAMADVLGMSFRRIQGTPDLTPGDITGSVVRNTTSGEFEIKEGPIFSNVILFDEINRTGPKVQSALLEAMQEKQVTLNGETRKLPKPFFVVSTQNPFDNEGVYPLTEAGKDRFMMRVDVDYPSEDIEHKIATKPSGELRLAAILDAEKVMAV
ncbi:MAG: ATPase associated with various cellular 3, partial [Micavibrio sp.]|nr:ATPase associated with various cellular 3 [Micavibrio sp.]